MFVVVLGLAVFLAGPASAGGMTAQGATAEDGLVSSERGTAAVRLNSTDLLFQGTLSGGSWTHVDEVQENGIRTPVGPKDRGTLFSEWKRNVVNGSFGSGALSLLASDDDAMMLVLPADQPLSMQAVSAAFGIEPTKTATLEKSHVVSGGPTLTLAGPSTFVYYQYDVAEVLDWQPAAEASLIIHGTFKLYVWGASVTFASGEGSSSEWLTGVSVEPGYDQAGVPVTENIHARYLVIDAVGTLRISGPGHALALYASTFSTDETSKIQFAGTQGQVAGRGGSFETKGTATAEDGSYVLSYEDGIIGVQVTNPPASVVGPQVTYVPDPLHQRPWFAPTLLGAILLVCVLLASYGYPTMRGLLHLKTMESLTGHPRPRGWSKVRAEGFAMMAAAAEEAGHPRRAAFWMTLACRLDPHDAEKTLDAGIFLQAVGRSREALELHKVAHDAFVEAGDPDNIAHNAYEAAKVVAEHGSPEQALDWLRIALQADPALVYEVGSDPRFYRLRDQPDYASLTSAGAA